MVLDEIGELLETLRQTGLTMILAEQNHHFALRHADRAHLIEKGAIRHEAPAAELEGSDALHRYLGVQPGGAAFQPTTCRMRVGYAGRVEVDGGRVLVARVSGDV